MEAGKLIDIDIEKIVGENTTREPQFETDRYMIWLGPWMGLHQHTFGRGTYDSHELFYLLLFCECFNNNNK